MLSNVQKLAGKAGSENFHRLKGHGKLLTKWLAANLCRWQRRGGATPPFHHPLYAQLGSLLLTAIYFAGDQSEMCNEIANYI